MRLLVAVAGVAAMVALAGTAHGDPDADAAFIASLQATGITYNDTEQAILTANAVCRLMTNGLSAPQILARLQARNPDLGPEHGGQFIAIAARSYCPEQLAPGTARPDAEVP